MLLESWFTSTNFIILSMMRDRRQILLGIFCFTTKDELYPEYYLFFNKFLMV